ncbi:uncharacterized protein LOC133928181 [Phragmites australis]|uniref:uncharacterized protein LOC133928181 n=1 Tax=Phragmites australis TaxID=29695 RepID=UPI002D7718FE|nr:uncharacterized protein LOC133928181 [Phragmites australis]
MRGRGQRRSGRGGVEGGRRQASRLVAKKMNPYAYRALSDCRLLASYAPSSPHSSAPPSLVIISRLLPSPLLPNETLPPVRSALDFSAEQPDWSPQQCRTEFGREREGETSNSRARGVTPARQRHSTAVRGGRGWVLCCLVRFAPREPPLIDGEPSAEEESESEEDKPEEEEESSDNSDDDEETVDLGNNKVTDEYNGDSNDEELEEEGDSEEGSDEEEPNEEGDDDNDEGDEEPKEEEEKAEGDDNDDDGNKDEEGYEEDPNNPHWS